MGDRFRLVYLKSPETASLSLETSLSDETNKNRNDAASSFSSAEIPKTLSSETILKQVRDDLKHPDAKIRILAVKFCLEKCYPSIPLPLIQEIFSDKDPGIREQALCSLIKFRDPTVVTLLKKHLKDSDPKVRIAALRGIFHYWKEKVDLNLLLQFLSDDSVWVRRKVATLLGWTQMEGVLPVLMEMSRDQEASVRKAALFSLMTLYPEEGENRFIEAMRDPDPELRKWVRMTLEKIVKRPFKKNRISLSSQ